MYFFSNTLTKSDYKKLDKKSFLLIPHRKIEAVLNLPDFWIVVIRERLYDVYATKFPHQLFSYLLDFDKLNKDFNNVTGSLTKENLDEDFNKMISHLIITSNLIIHQRNYNTLTGIQSWVSPDTRISTMHEYNVNVQQAFTTFDTEAENIDDQ